MLDEAIKSYNTHAVEKNRSDLKISRLEPLDPDLRPVDGDPLVPVHDDGVPRLGRVRDLGLEVVVGHGGVVGEGQEGGLGGVQGRPGGPEVVDQLKTEIFRALVA